MARRATEKAHTKPELMCHESRSRMSIAAELRTVQRNERRRGTSVPDSCAFRDENVFSGKAFWEVGVYSEKICR